MRLFIAVNFNGDTIKKILEIQNRIRSQSQKGSFTREENFHLTLAFLGETPGEKVDTLCMIIKDIRADPFELSFTRTGCFT
ncbi:MAG: RNA 2',3'-cyclic phosphodiesterase, partial [Treponema sp.]|nr:RNA 2',3'-cyclic phosphodiesterase [Treponema sp.]